MKMIEILKNDNWVLILKREHINSFIMRDNLGDINPPLTRFDVLKFINNDYTITNRESIVWEFIPDIKENQKIIKKIIKFLYEDFKN
jgi:hypothetical protein